MKKNSDERVKKIWDTSYCIIVEDLPEDRMI